MKVAPTPRRTSGTSRRTRDSTCSATQSFTESRPPKPLHHHAFEAWYGTLPYKIKRTGNGYSKICLGMFLQGSAVAIFMYFMLTTYFSKISTPFLALKEDVGQCKRVTVAVTDTQLVDKNGNWEASSSFDSTEALFFLSFSEYEATDASWHLDMSNVNSAIQEEMLVLAEMSDLPTKILHLVSWRSEVSATIAGQVTVWFNADPASIFDLTNQRFDSTIGKSQDQCDSEDGWQLNEGIYTMSFMGIWDGTTATQTSETFTSTCPSFDPSALGFDWSYPTENFDLNVDIVTALTIASLNAGIIDKDDLVFATDRFYEFPNDDTVTEVQYDNRTLKYDPKYPQMNPIYYDASGVYPVQKIGRATLTPTFEGTMYTESSGPGGGGSSAAKCPSQCSSSASFCSTPDFTFSFAPSTQGDWASSSPSNEFSFQCYTNQLFKLNAQKMDAGAIGCAVNTTGGNGKLGHLQPDTSTSAFKDAMTGFHPFKLQEGYFTCYPPVYDVVIDALGIAQGNTGLFLEVILLLVVLGLLLTPDSCSVTKKSVTEEETDHINFTIAEVIKKIEHGNNELHQFSSEQLKVIDAVGVMVKLAQEREALTLLAGVGIDVSSPNSAATAAATTTPVYKMKRPSVSLNQRNTPSPTPLNPKPRNTPSPVKEKELEMMDIYDEDKIL